MGIAGGLIGGGAGRIAGGYFGGEKGAEAGQAIGSVLGGLIPYFKKGGKVAKTGPAMLHGGEYVLPAGVKPTMAQKKAVAKLHKK